MAVTFQFKRLASSFVNFPSQTRTRNKITIQRNTQRTFILEEIFLYIQANTVNVKTLIFCYFKQRVTLSSELY